MRAQRHLFRLLLLGFCLHVTTPSFARYYSDGYEYSGDELVAIGVTLLCLLPFYGPYLGFENARSWTYPSYPFKDGTGYAARESKPMGLRISGGTQWTKGVAAARGEGAFLINRFEIDGAWVDQVQTRDHFYDGYWSVVPTYILGQDTNWQFRTGVGYEKILGDPRGRAKALYGIRVFVKPVQFTLEGGFSGINQRDPALEISPGIGLHLDRLELKAAYRHRTTGKEIREGPELSLALWF